MADPRIAGAAFGRFQQIMRGEIQDRRQRSDAAKAFVMQGMLNDILRERQQLRSDISEADKIRQQGEYNLKQTDLKGKYDAYKLWVEGQIKEKEDAEDRRRWEAEYKLEQEKVAVSKKKSEGGGTVIRTPQTINQLIDDDINLQQLKKRQTVLDKRSEELSSEPPEAYDDFDPNTGISKSLELLKAKTSIDSSNNVAAMEARKSALESMATGATQTVTQSKNFVELIPTELEPEYQRWLVLNGISDSYDIRMYFRQAIEQ